MKCHPYDYPAIAQMYKEMLRSRGWKKEITKQMLEGAYSFWQEMFMQNEDPYEALESLADTMMTFQD